MKTISLFPHEINESDSFKFHSDEDILELALHISQHGQINPCSISEKDQNYDLLTGFRRYKAVQRINNERWQVIKKNLPEKYWQMFYGDADDLKILTDLLLEKANLNIKVEMFRQ